LVTTAYLAAIVLMKAESCEIHQGDTTDIVGVSYPVPGDNPYPE
jgi:hypothetical protein